MATKKKRGRKGHRRTRNWVWIRGAWKKIVYFEGYEMRRMLPDLGIMLWRGDEGLVDSGFIPPDEIWIDSDYAAETDFQLEIYRVDTMRRWTKEPYVKQRAYLKRKLCRPGPIPPFVEREERDEEHELNIVYVRGEIVRKYLDPHFAFGGHDLVYGDYITSPRTIWVDVRQDPRELKYTLFHEITERKLMSRAKEPMSYDDAHEETTARELKARARQYLVWPVRKTNRLMAGKSEPLEVVPLEQEGDATCGPAGLRMMLNFLKRKYRGKPFTEAHIAEICRCSEEGTEHSDLIRGAKALGANVFAKEHGTIDELRHFILKERLPVLVGWWSGPERTNKEVQDDHDRDEGHFSVAFHITRTHVWLADSWIPDPKHPKKGAAGVRRVPLRKFMRQSATARPEFSWCDTDTKYYLPVNRWYMVLNFESKTWKFPGFANH